ncbi:MAG TPA: hypothetical protein VKY89_02760 [Thermoanaerobaculia bacterium]|nr:hypothetical protein [Thermoanaerobaculia bacterium]
MDRDPHEPIPYLWIPVAAFAVLLVIFLYFWVKVPPKASVSDQLALLVGCVILILVSCIGLVVLINMATNRIDLSQLVSEPGGGASLSRFQFLIFTFVIALGLFLVVAHSFSFPQIPSAVLTLLGISGTTYAVGKGITATDPTRMNKVNPPPHAAAHVPPAAPAAPIAPAPGAPAAAVPPVANQ